MELPKKKRNEKGQKEGLSISDLSAAKIGFFFVGKRLDLLRVIHVDDMNAAAGLCPFSGLSTRPVQLLQKRNFKIFVFVFMVASSGLLTFFIVDSVMGLLGTIGLI
ncbi:hypothetical protein Ancab_011029 [Ancistrocladus abbreviatus]